MCCLFALNHSTAVGGTDDSLESVCFVRGVESQTCGNTRSGGVAHHITSIYTLVVFRYQQTIYVFHVKFCVHGQTQKDQVSDTPNAMAEKKMCPARVKEQRTTTLQEASATAGNFSGSCVFRHANKVECCSVIFLSLHECIPE